MNLIEFYNSIKDPIEDLDILKNIVEAYGDTADSFNNRLTSIQEKENIQPSHNSIDSFYVSMFNDWKKSIILFDKIVQIEDAVSKEDFIKMREYLTSVPKVTTKKEVEAILSGKNATVGVKKTLKRFRWDKLNDGYWTKLRNYVVDISGQSLENHENRLYINIDSEYIYEFATILKKKYDEHGIPFAFKFNADDNRDDCFVIYTNNQFLLENVKILKEIKAEYPALKEHFKKPTILSGVLDGWIGYADEVTNNQVTQESYNMHRVKVIKEAIDSVTAALAINYDYTGEFYKVLKEFIEECVKEQVQTLNLNKLKFWKSGSKLTFKEINFDSFQNAVFAATESYMYDELSRIKDGNEPIDGSMKCYFNNKQVTLHFKASRINYLMRHLSNISKNEPQFFSLLQEKIKEISQKYGIDENKFCFEATSRKNLEFATIDSIKKINLCISVLKPYENEDTVNQLNKFLEQYLNNLQLDNNVELSYNLENMSNEDIKLLEKKSFEFLSLTLQNEGKTTLYNDLNSFKDRYFNNKIIEVHQQENNEPAKAQEQAIQIEEIEQSQNTEKTVYTRIKPRGKRTYSIKDDFIINSNSGQIIDQRNYTEFEKIISIQNIDKSYDYQQDEVFINMLQEYMKDIVAKISLNSNPDLLDLKFSLEQETTKKMIEKLLDEVIVESLEEAKESIKSKENLRNELSFEKMKFAADNFEIIRENDAEIIYDIITGDEINDSRTITIVKNAQFWINAVGINTEINNAFCSEYEKIFNFIKANVIGDDEELIKSEKTSPLPKDLEKECEKIKRYLTASVDKGDLKNFFSLNVKQHSKVKKDIINKDTSK